MDRRHLYGATFGIVGLLLAGVQLIHAAEQTDVAIAIVVDGLPFALLGLTLSFVGYWLATNAEYDADLPRIAAWTVGGTLLFAAVAALSLFSQRVATGTLQRVTYFTVDNVTVGALAGTLVGLYDARGQHHRRELQRERDRTEEFARKAADLNNYGRALSQATSVEEVAAYCIQGVSSLLGHDETAFVEVDNDDVRLVSNTVSSVPEETIRTIGRTAADGTAVVDVHRGADSPVSASLVTVHLDGAGNRTAVLVSVRETTEPVSAEDEQLLELLASHASMVLDRLSERRRSEFDVA